MLGKNASIRTKLPTAACWSGEKNREKCEVNLLYALINVKPKQGRGRATRENLTVTYIPGVGILIGHQALDLSISNSRREVNHLFLVILTIIFARG